MRQIKRQILAAHLVKATHNPALQERPKTINGLSVGGTVFGMTDDAMREIFSQFPVARMFIGREQADFSETTRATKGVGRIEETLKWGQPSYLTPETKSGSTIRIDRVKASPGRYAIFFHCQTDLVETFRELYPTEMSYGGNRCIVFDVAQKLPEPELRHCVALALTYHLRKRKGEYRPSLRAKRSNP